MRLLFHLIHKTLDRPLLCFSKLPFIVSCWNSNFNLFRLSHHQVSFFAKTKMSMLHVKNNVEDDRLQISLDLQIGNALKTVNLYRLKNEELSLTLERLRANLLKKTTKKPKNKNKKAKKEQKTDSSCSITEAACMKVDEESEASIAIEILHNGEAVPLSTLNEKAWVHGATLRVGDETVSVTYNPPAVKLSSICSPIMENFTLFVTAKCEFCDIENCDFHWKTIEKKHVDMVNRNACNGIFDLSNSQKSVSYTPTSDDIGKHILLTCEPKSGDKIGKTQYAISDSAVTCRPETCPFEKRQELTKQSSRAGEFRVISYNILADVYTSTEFAESFLFAHLPKDALAINYRKQLLLKEISGYKADIVCLQEVDKSVFFNHLSPGLNHEGFDGFFTPKKGGNSEGCATFIRKDKFRVVNNLDIVLSDYLSSDESCRELWEQICQVDALKTKVEQRSSILQVTVMESVERPGQYVCSANTHLYFHPKACNIRLIHAATALRYLQAVCSAYTQEGKEISMVFCGDFNSSPDVGVYQLMTAGFIPADQIDWLSGGEEEALKGVELSHPLAIVSACGTPDFTHYGAPIQCTLDYVFVETSRLEVVSSLPFFDLADVTTHTFLPNPLMPSDHLALVADVKFTSLTG